jgi:hypothetical protein
VTKLSLLIPVLLLIGLASNPSDAQQTTWTDPATGLMWAKRDNNSNVTWQQASNYCTNLQLDGKTGWRLPTIDELQGIYEPSKHRSGWPWTWTKYHTKGNLRFSGWAWSSSQGNASGEAWYFNLANGTRYSAHLGNHNDRRALCVRRSGE